MKAELIARIEELGKDMLALAAEMKRQNPQNVDISFRSPRQQSVLLKQLLKEGDPTGCALPLFIGKNDLGNALIIDLATLPHLLVGGATGQGKSVLLNSIICGLVSRYSPADVQFVLYDEKCVEFNVYKDLPHLVVPVITDCRRLVFAMHWAVAEMEKRLKAFARVQCRNISEFNQSGKGSVPYIVIVADEICELIARAGKELIPDVARLTAMGRAVGIHVILATQRPDTKVVSGMLKANMPGRIAFKTATSRDSRMLIDEPGAEKLLGCGDMIFKGKDGAIEIAQGAIISDADIAALVAKAAKKYEKLEPSVVMPECLSKRSSASCHQKPRSDEEDCALAIEVIRQTKRASTAHFQRRLGWGYNHAAAIIDLLQQRGIVTPPVGAGSREICWDKMPKERKSKKRK